MLSVSALYNLVLAKLLQLMLARNLPFPVTYCTLTAKEVEDDGYCHNTKIQNIIRHFRLLGTPEHDILALECEMLILKSLI
ncbi:hypothetical protein ACS0TY_023552 [Phlomoides rotata]